MRVSPREKTIHARYAPHTPGAYPTGISVGCGVGGYVHGAVRGTPRIPRGVCPMGRTPWGVPHRAHPAFKNPGVCGGTRGTRGYPRLGASGPGYLGVRGGTRGTRGYPARGKQTEVPGGTRGYPGTPAYPIYDNQEVRGGTRGTRGYPGTSHRVRGAYPASCCGRTRSFSPGEMRHMRVSPRQKCNMCAFLPRRNPHISISPWEKSKNLRIIMASGASPDSMRFLPGGNATC
jgi:hypothetical protein